MDIYCKVCGEPWGIPVDMTKEELSNMLTGYGCPCCKGRKPEATPPQAELMGIAQDLMGDDLDGIASMMDDAEFMGLF